MKGWLILWFNLLLISGTVSWAQNNTIQQPFLLNSEVGGKFRIIPHSHVGDTTQLLQLMESGNRLLKINPESAVSVFSYAFKLSQQINYDQGMAIALLSLGSYFSDYKDDYKQAKIYFDLAIPYCQRAENRKLLPGVYNCIAKVYFHLNKYDSSMHFFYKGLEVIKSRPWVDTQQLIKFYAGLGAVVGNLEQNGRALQYFKKAAEWGQSYQKDSTVLTTVFKNMGSLYYKLGNLDSALRYYNKALQLYQGLGANEDIQNMYNYIATVWLYEKDLPEANRYLDSAVNADIKGLENNLELLQNLGCVYYFSGKFEEATAYYKKSLKLINSTDAFERHKLNIYQTLAAIYDTLGQGHLAYQYQVAYSKLKDTLYNENMLKTVNQLEVQYRTSEKDKELAQKQLLIAQQQNKIQQQYLWIGGAVIGILILLGVFYRKRHKAAIAELKAILAGEERERRRMAAELHDGIVSKLSSVKMNFDALAPAYAYTPEENTEFREALQLLEQSIAELRTTSQNLQPSILKKAGLIPAVAIYCDKINKVAPPLVVDFQLVGELPPLNEDFQLNIYRIIQELVNNIVKHSKATRALVQFNAGPRQLQITVEDNGVGLPPEKLDADNGIGLFNLRRRLKLLNGTVDIATQNGTSIYLEFDLHSFIEKTT